MERASDKEIGHRDGETEGEQKRKGKEESTRPALRANN
jgi:hypothetical protein